MIEFPLTLDIYKCTHCGKCLYNCPLYEKYLDQVFSPRGKIILLEHQINNNDIFICSYCGNCVNECPINIDLPAHLLIKVWPKYFYKLNISTNNKLTLKNNKSILWKKMTKKNYEEDLSIIKKASFIETDTPLYYLFLKKLKFYHDMPFKLKFLHKKGNIDLPLFMRGFAKKGDHYKKIFYYEK